MHLKQLLLDKSKCTCSFGSDGRTVPVSGTVTVTVPVPLTKFINVTVPNVPVLVFTPQNVTLPTVVVPILWSSPIAL